MSLPEPTSAAALTEGSDPASNTGVNDAAVVQELVRVQRDFLAAQRRLEAQAAHLAVALSLGRHFVSGHSQRERLTEVCKALTLAFRVQRVVLFRCDTEHLTMTPLVGSDLTSRPLSGRARDLLAALPSGCCNNPTDDRFRDLAEAVAFDRFLWSRVDLGDGSVRGLLVVGFDRKRAVFRDDFDPSDVVSLDNLARQIGMHEANLALVTELQQEKRELQELRDGLERQVQARTTELQATNEALSQTLSALEERNRLILEDLEEARLFQERILASLPSHPRLHVAARYLPLDRVGGDLYNVAHIAPDVIRFFIADATGHGIQASLRTMMIASEYVRLRHAHARPQLVLSDLNKRLVSLFPDGDLMATALCFDIDLRSSPAKLRIADAGNPPLLHVSGEAVSEISAPGTILGISRTASYGVTELDLLPGDLLLAASDGVTEAQNFSGASYALDRERTLRLSAGKPTAEVFLDRLLEDLASFTEGRPRNDDLTALAISM